MDIRKDLAGKKRLIDAALDRFLPKAAKAPASIHRAMRYAVFSGGKRVRPILAVASCQACGGRLKDVLPYACAIELIHSYSLVHDDLPSLDNDDYRRGRPSCHKKFGESTAILVGDALLTLAFGLMAGGKDGKKNLRVIQEISQATGTDGMIGGQVDDLAFGNKKKTAAVKRYIDTRKTGALIAVSCRAGAIAAGASKAKVSRLFKYGQYLGHCFQVVDDILDGESDKRRYAGQLARSAGKAIEPFGKKACFLQGMADLVLSRDH